MTVKIEVSVNTGYANSVVKDILEIDIEDNATAEEIVKIKEAAAWDWAQEIIDWGWRDID